MKWINVLIICALTVSCVQLPPYKEEPAVVGYNNLYSDIEFRQYVDNANTALLMYFNYVRALNKIAITRGWKPPDRNPICEHIPWGVMRIPPPLSIPNTAKSSEEINEHLVSYIKLTRELYTLQREEFENLEKYAKELCSY